MAEEDEQVTWYWEDKPGIVAGISHRSAGWMNVYDNDVERGEIAQTNRDKFFAQMGLDSARAVCVTGLKHTTNVAAVGTDDAGKVIYGANGVDGLSTDQPGLVLASTMSDCLPLYFYDSAAKVVAVAHAGWRGVLNNMAETMVRHLQNNYPAIGLDNLKVLIGPSLRSCHFEVRSDVESLFKGKYTNYIYYQDGKIFIDLPAIVKFQLSQIGLLEDNIQDTGECTYDLPDRYFSFRRDHPPKPQSMVAFIALSNE
jgi:hypothetical protein